jgi:DNA polymerase (family X)
MLEIDGAPSHLDLDGDMARRAAAAGVTLTIDSDGHHAALMGRYMLFGVGTARRGWIEPASVANTRPVDELLTMLRVKRN